MTLSVRLNTKTTTLIRTLAKQRGQTQSEIVREAILDLAVRESAAGYGKTPYETIAHLVGCADSGKGNLSENTGKKFRALLEEKRRARRTR